MPDRSLPDGVLTSIDAHRQAEVLMARADKAATTNDPSTAASLRLQAARKEAQAFDVVPSERPRTRRILAISTVALYLQGGAYATAAALAGRYAAQPEIASDSWARDELGGLATDARALIELTGLARAGHVEEARARGAQMNEGLEKSHPVARAVRGILASLT